jgi:nitroreductase
MSDTAPAPAAIPSLDEALDRPRMPLVDAMRTQRAVRRVLPDPVDDAVVLKTIELALKAPTGSNGQNWEFVVVKDRAVKEQFAARYRQAWALYGRMGAGRRRRQAMLKILRAVRAGRALRRHPGDRGAVPAGRHEGGRAYPEVRASLIFFVRSGVRACSRRRAMGPASLITLPPGASRRRAPSSACRCQSRRCMVPSAGPGVAPAHHPPPVGDVVHLDRFRAAAWRAGS